MVGVPRRWAQSVGCHHVAGLHVPFVRVDAFEVREHDLAVQPMSMLVAGMFQDSVGDGVLVVAVELTAASGTRLVVGHACHPR